MGAVTTSVLGAGLPLLQSLEGVNAVRAGGDRKTCVARHPAGQFCEPPLGILAVLEPGRCLQDMFACRAFRRSITPPEHCVPTATGFRAAGGPGWAGGCAPAVGRSGLRSGVTPTWTCRCTWRCWKARQRGGRRTVTGAVRSAAAPLILSSPPGSSRAVPPAPTADPRGRAAVDRIGTRSSSAASRRPAIGGRRQALTLGCAARQVSARPSPLRVLVRAISIGGGRSAFRRRAFSGGPSSAGGSARRSAGRVVHALPEGSPTRAYRSGDWSGR